MEKNILNIEKQLNYQMIGMGKRFFGFILNMIFFYIIYLMLLFLVGVVGSLISPSFVQQIVSGDKVLIYIIYFAAYIWYFFLTEYIFGRSFGHMIIKARIVDYYGNKPTFKHVLIRTFCRFIPFDSLSFLGSGHGWHDSIAKTYVINSEYTIEFQD